MVMAAFSAVSVKLISWLLSVIFLPLSGLTLGVDLISASSRTDYSKSNVAGIGAYFRSQGVTTDGEYLYFSCKTALIRTDMSGKIADKANLSAIPDELKDEYGTAHIGGISFYDGKIYAGMEDSKVWDNPIVGVFDCETLQLEKYYLLDGEKITRGLPWVSVDPETGYLYCTDHAKKPALLLSYDISGDMAPVGETPIAGALPSVQGAEFLNGILYCATDDDTQAIYTVDPVGGEVNKVIDRNLTKGSEGEGMTFVERGGKTVILAIDLGPLFVNAFIREYNI